MDPVNPDDTERAPRLSTRPLRADAQRNRARVLAAAQDAFAADGLAVPLDEIARRAGVGAGTVYRHFPTKEALFEAVILDRLTRMVRYAQSLAEADEPGPAFFEMLHRLVTGASGSRDLADALAGSDLASAGQITAAKRELTQAGEVLLRRAQTAGAARGDIDIDDLMALVTGATMALRQPGEASRRDAVYAVLRDGLRPPGRSG
ncbi:MAG TPA: helix-turn-helix domain-containing protein [Actinophytocola sp.]|uniref:TetR/AcrR family transcriptional regulator n=1 Tax=Actinophytocola sp. TaxID=1872138 RepID=UPI002DB730EB|nr:helix-turn-helix domain-containing protein [Actinophytocola sp.]HEU5476068.1 helix-turn-helix domain-containing protein [Actinophytocola sp.]